MADIRNRRAVLEMLKATPRYTHGNASKPHAEPLREAPIRWNVVHVLAELREHNGAHRKGKIARTTILLL